MTLAANTIIAPTIILSGQTDSSSVNLKRGLLCGFIFPTMTGATVKLQTSIDEITWYDLWDDAGSAKYASITATDNGYVCLDTALVAGMAYIRLISSSAEAADRTVQVLYKQAT